MSRYVKTPTEVLDYGWDWSRWLDGDQIQSASWVIPTGLNLVSQSNDTASTTVWLSGGDLSTTYTITNRIITAAGRTAERVFDLRIIDRRYA